MCSSDVTHPTEDEAAFVIARATESVLNPDAMEGRVLLWGDGGFVPYGTCLSELGKAGYWGVDVGMDREEISRILARESIDAVIQCICMCGPAWNDSINLRLFGLLQSDSRLYRLPAFIVSCTPEEEARAMFARNGMNFEEYVQEYYHLAKGFTWSKVVAGVEAATRP